MHHYVLQMMLHEAVKGPNPKTPKTLVLEMRIHFSNAPVYDRFIGLSVCCSRSQANPTARERRDGARVRPTLVPHTPVMV